MRRKRGWAGWMGILVMAAVCRGAEEPATFRLWSGDAPGALGQKETDIPTLTSYLPEKACGTGLLICPGGGYGGLAGHEGEGYAEFFRKEGVTCFVLRYRLGSKGYHHPIMLGDVSRAMRTIRARANEWHLDPKRLGVIGSSAGGHLASTLLTHFDAGQADAADGVERVSSRPDFGILCYAVISMEAPFTHVGSRKNLLGPTPEASLLTFLSSERQITAQTPPCFIWHTADDPVVPVQNSQAFAQGLSEHKVPYEMHVYEHGSHGMGLGKRKVATDPLLPWTGAVLSWMRGHGWLP